ncbi:carbohydate-binding domain-containing protein [Fulvivirgaceae bacterium PWU4]|uniref:beta-N-acetylhexosaminidase n=1 Tax=Chryseosolibacter histidini TaxID=2782349 RepID=A0AAP2GQU1_9BACT|nr:family 20 glycosylhydrolase [Chryseosolibacter histidini]MBT1698872.1 carbohydate-binding domain-containing protein [Chryseosolibacter histidini]
MNKVFPNLLFCCALITTLLGCKPATDYASAGKIAVQWALITNFTDQKDVFEAKFTITNGSDIDLTDNNWALFFNMAPRPIVATAAQQPARLEHINGDWYKLVPNKSFSLRPGQTSEILYRGTEGVIKETDQPLGLYFVFYNSRGEEEKITEVTDYKLTPFTTPEQINRSHEDEAPIPTPAWSYNNNLKLQKLSDDQLSPITPSPVKVRKASGVFQVSNAVQIYYQGALKNEADHLAQALETLTGTAFSITDKTPKGPALKLQLGDVSVGGVKKEAYVLKISPKEITVTGSDAAGVFYGIQSLRSLVPLDQYKTKSPTFSLRCMTVEDAPRFGYRGLHLDVSRNFQTKETILRMLDLLAFYKINRFLFYTTEDEGWRLEIEGLPELTSVGAQREHTSGKDAPVLHPAYGSGPFAKTEGRYGHGYYSREDFIEILRYAARRHIKVIPELNFPGHARAAIKAMEARYQRFMKEGDEAKADEYRLIDPNDTSKYLSAQGYQDNVVSVARESTYRFYEKVVDEIAKMYVAAGLPMDEIHAGGDEVPEGAWTGSPMAAALLKDHPEIKDPKNLQVYFFRELLKRLRKRNLRVDGWEEVAILKTAEGTYVPNPEFAGQDVVPYIWNNLFDYQDLGYKLANAGYPIVLCNVSNFYFDLAHNKDPKEPGLYWAGFVDTRDAWTFAPYDMFITTPENSMGREIDMDKVYADKERLKPEARKNILGVEAQLWSETIKGREMVEYYMLPKLIGFSESAWSPAREWETLPDQAKREASMDREWNVFANTLGTRELPRLNYLHGGYNYRIPPPGAIVADGMLKANVEYPGLTIRFTLDGSEPDARSAVYEGPVSVASPVMLKCFDAAGRGSRVVKVDK